MTSLPSTLAMAIRLQISVSTAGPVQVEVTDVNEETDPADDVIWNTTTDNFFIYSQLTSEERKLSLYQHNWCGFVINGNLASNTIDETQLKPSDAYTTEPDLNNKFLDEQLSYFSFFH